jgi:hypothetical protein
MTNLFNNLSKAHAIICGGQGKEEFIISEIFFRVMQVCPGAKNAKPPAQSKYQQRQY